jgi:hypothetical protein
VSDTVLIWLTRRTLGYDNPRPTPRSASRLGNQSAISLVKRRSQTPSPRHTYYRQAVGTLLARRTSTARSTSIDSHGNSTHTYYSLGSTVRLGRQRNNTFGVPASSMLRRERPNLESAMVVVCFAIPPPTVKVHTNRSAPRDDVDVGGVFWVSTASSCDRTCSRRSAIIQTPDRVVPANPPDCSTPTVQTAADNKVPLKPRLRNLAERALSLRDQEERTAGATVAETAKPTQCYLGNQLLDERSYPVGDHGWGRRRVQGERAELPRRSRSEKSRESVVARRNKVSARHSYSISNWLSDLR